MHQSYLDLILYALNAVSYAVSKDAGAQSIDTNGGLPDCSRAFPFRNNLELLADCASMGSVITEQESSL